jgi:hypothetical protein
MSLRPIRPLVPQTLSEALRITAKRIEAGDRYQWTHMGACNCGHLAQTVTLSSPREIHEMALVRAGDWSEQTREYCPTSGLPIDHIIESLLQLGASLDELRDLERLSNSHVLKQIPVDRRRELSFRKRDDVALYMRTWATLIDEKCKEKQYKVLV